MSRCRPGCPVCRWRSAADIAPYAGHGRGDHGTEGPRHRQQRQRNKEQDRRGQQRADGKFEVEAPIGDRFRRSARQAR